MSTGVPRAGSFAGSYAITEADTNISALLPLSESASASTAGRANLSAELRAKCGMEPLTAMPQVSAVIMAGCSCTQLKGMIESELPSCINQTGVSQLFQNATTAWACSRSDVFAAMGGCGFSVRGC